MTRHSFRWPAAVCGIGFLLIALLWGVWNSDAVSLKDFSYAVAGTLIAGGLLGIAATIWPRKTESNG